MATPLSGIDQLLDHCKTGNEEEVRRAVKSNPEIINEGNDDGDTALHFAARYGHPNIVKFIIETEPKVDKEVKVRDPLHPVQGVVHHVNKHKRTALHVAVSRENEDIVRLLIKSGADADIRDNNFESPLHFAVHIGTAIPGRPAPTIEDKQKRRSIIQELLKSNHVGLEARDSCGRTPLSLAVQIGDTELVQMMMNIKPGIEFVDIADEQNKSPLLHALISGNDSIAEIFLDYKDCECDVNLMSKDGYTPLIAACEACNENIVQRLLDHPKIKVKIAGCHQQPTALNMAVHKGMSTSIIRQIAESMIHEDDGLSSAPGNQMHFIDKPRSRDGLTPFMVALETNQMEAAGVLKNLGANINCQDRNLKTALIRATEMQNEELVRWLLESGSDIDIVDNKGHDAVYVASRRNPRIAKYMMCLLLKQDVETEDEEDVVDLAASR